MIIGISGKIGTGKSTLAGILLKRLPNFERHAFGDCLKEACSEFFDYPLEWNYTEDGKNQEIHLGSSVANPFGPAVIIPPYASMTVRRLLQWWGTDICRAADPLYWDRRMAERIAGKNRVLVDDVRFPSEVAMLSELGALLVRLEPYEGWRPGPHAAHESETALDDYQGWDLVIRPALGELPRAAETIICQLGEGWTGKEQKNTVLGREGGMSV